MIYLIIVILSIGMMSIAFILLAIKNITAKAITGHTDVFPETSIGKNKKLKKAGIFCPQTLDAIERKKVRLERLASSCKNCSSETKS
ncbi:MAG TPA: hypothetical protein EYP69_03975 [Bacteroidales bacterium]|nr:hypothetical protein [Bacteroidales bacterium]